MSETSNVTSHDETWDEIRTSYVRPAGVFGHYGMESRQKAFDTAVAARDARIAALAKAEALRDAADYWGKNPDGWQFETDKDIRNWLRDGAEASA